MDVLLTQLQNAVSGVFTILIQMAVMALVPFVFNFLKEKVGITIATTFVNSIESMIQGAEGPTKKLVVTDAFKKRVGIFAFLFSTENVSHYIEAACNQMKIAQLQAASKAQTDVAVMTKSETEEKVEVPNDPTVKDPLVSTDTNKTTGT